MNTDNELYKSLDAHESNFIQSFVDVDRRKRWAEALVNKRKRNLFLIRLADSRDFIKIHMHPINPSPRTYKELLVQLKILKTQELCHIISQYSALDGCKLELQEAIRRVFGIGLGSIVSCVPGKLAYFEGEMPKDRWLLIAD